MANSLKKLKLVVAQDLYHIDSYFIVSLHLPLLNVGMLISGSMAWLLSLILDFNNQLYLSAGVLLWFRLNVTELET